MDESKQVKSAQVIAYHHSLVAKKERYKPLYDVQLVNAILKVEIPDNEDKTKWMYLLFGDWFWQDSKCPMPYREMQLMNVEFIPTDNLYFKSFSKTQYYVWCQFRARYIEPVEEPEILDKPLGSTEWYSSRGVK